MTSVEISKMRLLAHLFNSSRLWAIAQVLFSVMVVAVIIGSSSIMAVLIICLLLVVLLYYQLRLQLDAAILLDLSTTIINQQDLDQALVDFGLINQSKNNRTIEERCAACYSLWKKYLYLSAIHLVLSVWIVC